MGLDTSHDCWHGPYSSFMRWRQELAKAAGLPPLMLMEGYYKHDDPLQDPFWVSGLKSEKPNPLVGLPIKWDCLKPSALFILLRHSDCEGKINWKNCAPIASALKALLPKLGEWKGTTETFIKGLRLAARKHESVDFH